LKTRVQPYPPGYSEDFDEEELLEGEDGQTLDVGGYQRQQDTLIVWTERGDGDEEMEMALSFATSTGCAEMWEFIKAARRFTGERVSFPSATLEKLNPRHHLHSRTSSIVTFTFSLSFFPSNFPYARQLYSHFKPTSDSFSRYHPSIGSHDSTIISHDYQQGENGVTDCQESVRREIDSGSSRSRRFGESRRLARVV